MRECLQTPTQNTLQHGFSVWKNLYKLAYTDDHKDFRLPQWFSQYKSQLKNNLHDFKTLKHYSIFHDCGKFACLTVDENGKKHFPDHANVSASIFKNHIRNDETILRLIKNDMIFHTLKYDEIIALKLSTKDLCSLMLTALSELHANAALFGGIESDSFKIKWKRLDKLGKKICYQLFDHPYVYVITRKDLSVSQQAVQSCHAVIESTKAFSKNMEEHPSVIICSVKSEHKLKDTIQYLYDNGIKMRAFKEPDICNEYTSIATEPLYGERRKLMNKFQLMKG